MDGLYQDVIIMLTIFVFGLIALKAYYKLKIDFDELQTDFHRLAEGREYVEDIDSQAYAQGRTSSRDEIKEAWEIGTIERMMKSTEIVNNMLKSATNDMLQMQDDIIGLKQGQINLNAKIKNNDIITAMSRISVQDILSNENE